LRRGGAGGAGVSNLELFHDLVFVFAITQVSDLLLGHRTWTGAAHLLVVVLVVWWSWNFVAGEERRSAVRAGG
jgi:low temperature requirement protein LtrA